MSALKNVQFGITGQNKCLRIAKHGHRIVYVDIRRGAFKWPSLKY